MDVSERRKKGELILESNLDYPVLYAALWGVVDTQCPPIDWARKVISELTGRHYT